MSRLIEWLGLQPQPMSFNTELSNLCARWSDRSRKGTEALTAHELADALRFKAGQLDRQERR